MGKTMEYEQSCVSWIDSEFAALDLGDERLTKRFLFTAKRLMACPERVQLYEILKKDGMM
jgi:hypothetical protein